MLPTDQSNVFCSLLLSLHVQQRKLFVAVNIKVCIIVAYVHLIGSKG